MKKLIMALAIGSVAVAAHASKVQWGISTGSLSGFGTGSKMYLFEGTYDAEKLALWADTASKFTFDNVKTQLGGNLINFDTSVYGSLVNELAFSGSGTTSQVQIESYDSGKTGSVAVYLVAINQDGSAMAISSGKNLNIMAGQTQSNAKWGASSLTPYTASAVPEPTSGLLLLLGVAGLALRRRRA